MHPPDVEGAWRAIAAGPPDEMDRDACRGRLRELRRLRAWLDAEEIRTTRRLRELEKQGRAEPVDAALANEGGHSGRDARNASDREEAANDLPGFERALGDGEVSAGHLDVLAAAMGGLGEELATEFRAHEPELLRHAATESVDAFRRRCRRLAKQLIAAARADDDIDELAAQREAVKVTRRIDATTGMHCAYLELDPVRATAFWGAVDAHLERLRARHQDANAGSASFRELQADALVEAVSTDRAGSRRMPEISVLIDWATLRQTATEVGICETIDGAPLPVATIRRLACDAEVYPVVLGGSGETLDKGRGSRTAGPAQRAALGAMHATCAHPDCRVGFSHTRAHHVAHWTGQRGPTDLDNLLPLCETHHHLVHEGGWQLTMTPDRVATWRLPDGTLYHQGSTIDRTPREGKATCMTAA